jgi:hypothetical protein
VTYFAFQAEDGGANPSRVAKYRNQLFNCSRYSSNKINNMATATPTSATKKIANQANDKLTKLLVELGKVTDGLKTTADAHVDLTYKIEEKEAALAALDTNLQEEERRRTAELEIKLKENEAKTIQQILNTQGKSMIATSELTELQADLQDYQANFENKVAEAVNKVKQEETARANAIVRQKELELQVKEAANSAAITSLTDKNQLLATQVSDYKTQLEAERAARVEEAKARGAAMVTVNSSGR